MDLDRRGNLVDPLERFAALVRLGQTDPKYGRPPDAWYERLDALVQEVKRAREDW